MMKSLGEHGPHDSVTAEQQARAQQPEGRVQLRKHTRLHGLIFMFISGTNMRLLMYLLFNSEK